MHVWSISSAWIPILDENRKFFLPLTLSFSALVQGDPFQIYGKALPFLKLVFQAGDGEDMMILACTVSDWSTRVTDRWMDR